MTYEKPKVVVLSRALRAIQKIDKPEAAVLDNNTHQFGSDASAYEADE
jgi:hypothetical protein